MTGLIIFTLFCLVLFIYLSVRYNSLLKNYVEVTNNGHNIVMVYKKQQEFMCEKGLIDEYNEFSRGRK